MIDNEIENRLLHGFYVGLLCTALAGWLIACSNSSTAVEEPKENIPMTEESSSATLEESSSSVAEELSSATLEESSSSLTEESSSSGTLAKPGTYTLPLFQTSDIHGYLVNVSADTVHYKLAYISDKVKDIRGYGAANDRRKALLLDGGDLYQGTTLSNLAVGAPIYVAFDLMGYDAVALGNHEFDWGVTNMVDRDGTLPEYTYLQYSSKNEVPVLAANLNRNGQKADFVKDYVIVEKLAKTVSGDELPVRIGVIGFLEDWSGSMMTSVFAGYSIDEDVGIVERIAQTLEKDSACDMTIILAHGAADEIADKLNSKSVVDLVLGGHTHENLMGKSASGVPYMEPVAYGEGFAYADLVFNVNDSGKVSFVEVSKMDTVAVDAAKDMKGNSKELDAEIVEFSDKALEDVASLFEEKIGYITVSAIEDYTDTSTYIPNSYNRSSTMGNWMTDIYRRIAKADVAFVNGGGVRTQFPVTGERREITVANIYEMFPFGNAIYVYEITYGELKRLFDYALTKTGGSLISRMVGIDCYFDTEWKMTGLVKDGTVIYKNGEWIGDWESRTVTIATNEYVATINRIDDELGGNPLNEWNGTNRLKESEQIDNEAALWVLREEASDNGGLLWIDTTAHFIPPTYGTLDP